VKRGEGNTNSPELSLLKILPLAYHHSHFLAATFDFTSFFTMAFLGLHTAGLFWIRLLLIKFLGALYNSFLPFFIYACTVVCSAYMV